MRGFFSTGVGKVVFFRNGSMAAHCKAGKNKMREVKVFYAV